MPPQEGVVRASPTGGETAWRARTAHPLEKSQRPTNGLLAPGELPAGIMGATTVSARLSGISDSTQVPFGRHLQELCDDLAARFGRSGGPRLTCEAADEALPMSAATVIALIAEVLVTDAFVHGFPPARGGRIAASFTAGQGAWQLTVDDSGIAVRSHGDPRDLNLTIARQLVLHVGGRLALPKVTGGTRCIVTLPRPCGERRPPTTAASPIRGLAN
jgi:two-component sensor histidine kinase